MIFVFEIRIKSGYSPERYSEAWVEASKIIQSSLGAKGTRLHRRIGADDRLLAIAQWESKSSRDAAESNRDERVQVILDAQSDYVEIQIVGEFEDPEWVVLPE
jgi:hypothetical protein